MTATSRYFKLGVFVIGAVILFVAIVLIVGSGSFGRVRVTMETYFNESVQGLDIGSKVKYRGVTIGDVTTITFVSTRYERDKPAIERKQYVLVEAKLDPRLLGARIVDLADRGKIVRERIERGLRVRMNPQGITGTSYLEIDFLDPATNQPLAIDWEPENLYIPSASSTVKQFVDAASDFLAELRKADLANLGNTFKDTINQLNQLVATTNDRVAKFPVETIGRDLGMLVEELRGSNRRLNETLAAIPLETVGREAAALMTEVRETNRRLAGVLDDPALAKLPAQASQMVTTTTATFERMRGVLDQPELGRSVAQLQRTLARLERILVGREGDIATTLENLRVISDNLRDTTETARHYPSQLLLGEPPLPARSTR